ncbi:hypothetical protein J7E99_00650 [Streptomyces sp. ISL-44]|uniref:hypothetical protein n=1 Tax=unclassified Streptomyces TaxID=2593676 RepID=UPI001BE7A5DE|nr:MULTISPECIES: hypothetical protein [unclassified Streptomyces]MBT2539252.1 hypothetical protein [Streptomyces sp. ISL-44]MCX5012505.1 hypothetical protein [Streptomyces sp. NBC_00555]MCX5606470.1 hypothetical protein [Streptomyces sp. NBC_00047]UUU40711.1 hypothetical protein JIW86_18890 [Streptomyces sp. NBC_00162]
MSEHVETPSEEGRRNPHKVRLPGFINDEEIGLGDVVRRATSAVGIKPCGGCTERARRLNDWMVFSPQGSADS